MKEFKIISKTVEQINPFYDDKKKDKWKNYQPLTTIEFIYDGRFYYLSHDDMTFDDNGSFWNVVIKEINVEEGERNKILFYYACDLRDGNDFYHMILEPEFESIYEEISIIEDLKVFLPEGSLEEIRKRIG